MKYPAALNRDPEFESHLWSQKFLIESRSPFG
jgi:hypothetical protein